MDIFEFELRRLAYQWLAKRYNFSFDEKRLINLVKRSDKWKLSKKLQETSPDELKALTEESFSRLKKFILDQPNSGIVQNLSQTEAIEKFYQILDNFYENFEKIKDYQWITHQIKIKKDSGKIFSLYDYIYRLEYELKVIKEMWYNTYFLIVQDYINWAKENKIAVWPGRWSAAWSLLAYLIWITDIDPLEYDLLFERFLNPARVSMPDIDTDFEDVKRDLLIDYVAKKYWREKVANIGTYMTMAAKAAFKDVARAMGMPFEEANKISELITEKTLEKSLETNEALRELVETDDRLKKIFHFAMQLEGTVRQTGVHACWVIISPEPITEYSPIQHPPKPGNKWEKDTSRVVTQYDGHYLEDIGLLKMDFLGLRNLSIIKNTIKIIKARLQDQWKPLPQIFQKFFETMGFYPPLDDKKVYEEIFQKWNTSWVFQFESDGMRRWLKQLKPTNIDDIIAMVALYRPGPMDFIPSYIKRKHWEEKIEYLPPEIYEILKNKYWKQVADEERKKITEDLSPFMNVTYWIPIYQEQLMRIVQAMAWFSLGEADLLRRWVWKKIKEIIDKLKKEFIERAEKYRWYKPETSTYVYEKMIEPAANYSFNKSHAACYAIIAYQTAWLKTHYPLEFHAALLRSVEENTDKLSKLVEELKLKWFKVLPPHINKSFAHIAAVDDSIILWFLSIKGIWEDVAEFIEQERKSNWDFKSIEDFLKRCKPVVNKKSLEALAKAGAFEWFINRKTILKNIDKILDWLKGLDNINQWWWLLFWNIETKLNLKEEPEDLMEKLKLEYEIFKTFVSAHPLDWLFKRIKWKYNFISMFKDIEDYWEFKILGVIKDIRKVRKKWVWIDIEDISGTISLFLKDNFDLKKFDIIAVYGYKWKSEIPRVSEIHRFKLEELIQKAKKAKKYFEEDKVFNVRNKRFQAQETETTNEINKNLLNYTNNLSVEWDIKPSCDIKTNVNNCQIENTNSISLSIPDDISKIYKICEIIKKSKKQSDNCILVKLGNETFKVCNEDLEILKKLCK